MNSWLIRAPAHLDPAKKNHDPGFRLRGRKKSGRKMRAPSNLGSVFAPGIPLRIPRPPSARGQFPEDNYRGAGLREAPRSPVNTGLNQCGQRRDGFLNPSPTGVRMMNSGNGVENIGGRVSPMARSPVDRGPSQCGQYQERYLNPNPTGVRTMNNNWTAGNVFGQEYGGRISPMARSQMDHDQNTSGQNWDGFLNPDPTGVRMMNNNMANRQECAGRASPMAHSPMDYGPNPVGQRQDRFLNPDPTGVRMMNNNMAQVCAQEFGGRLSQMAHSPVDHGPNPPGQRQDSFLNPDPTGIRMMNNNMASMYAQEFGGQVDRMAHFPVDHGSNPPGQRQDSFLNPDPTGVRMMNTGMANGRGEGVGGRISPADAGPPPTRRLAWAGPETTTGLLNRPTMNTNHGNGLLEDGHHRPPQAASAPRNQRAGATLPDINPSTQRVPSYVDKRTKKRGNTRGHTNSEDYRAQYNEYKMQNMRNCMPGKKR